MNAFAEAYNETSGAVASRRPLRRRRVESIRGKVHREDLEEDVQRTWKAIQSMNQDVVGFSQLCDGGKWKNATFFLSILFLSSLGWLEIWQEDFPWGEVYLRPLRQGAIGDVVVDPVAAEVA